MSITLSQVLSAMREANTDVNRLQRRINAVDNAAIIRHLFTDGVFDTSGTDAQYGFKITASGMDLYCSKTGTITAGNVSEAIAYGYYVAIDDSSGGPFATLPDGDATNPRRDIVWANRFKIGVAQGTPAASPADPSIPADAISLYRVTVPAGETDGSGLTLTDLREFIVLYQTANGILAAIKTVDGSGSGLDADLLDGHDSTYFAGLSLANTFTETNEFDKNIELTNTTYANQYGVITKNGTRFIHNFNYGDNGTVTTSGGNLFIGENAGNFTMGSTATATYHSSYNIGIGTNSLHSASKAFFSIGIGQSSLYYVSTAVGTIGIGAQSLYYLTTGNYNIGIGKLVMYNITTGGYNIGIGNEAGRFIADGTTANQTSSYSFYLGANTKPLADGDTNEIVIGYNAIGAGSNTATLGNTSITKTYLRGKIYNTGATTSTTATAGSATLPANPVGFLTINIGGTDYKLPYYAV